MTGISGWVQHHGVHLLTLYPPRGGGRIRIYERLRPLLRASEVVARVLRDDPAFRLTRLGRAAPLTTNEGELGAWVDVEGMRDGVWVRRAIAMIFADDFVVAFDVLAIEPGRWDEVDLAARELVVSHQLGLGVRRRRYIYTAPAGWTPLARGLVTYYYPPEFPRDPSLLVVHPATPSPPLQWDPAPHQLIADLADGLDGRERVVDQPFAMVGSAPARHVAMFGTTGRSKQKIARHAIVQYAAPYLYVIRLDRSEPDHGEVPAVLDAVARSMVTLPAADSRVIPRAAAAFAHWAD